MSGVSERDQRDQRSWQIHGAGALPSLLATASEAELPALDWRVTRFSDLIGEVPTFMFSHGEALAMWQAWVTFLSADVQGTGAARRVAVAMYRASEGAAGVRVVLVADLDHVQPDGSAWPADAGDLTGGAQ